MLVLNSPLLNFLEFLNLETGNRELSLGNMRVALFEQEMVQLVKHLPHKHEDQSSDPHSLGKMMEWR